jgi:hypothetical protein
MKSFFSDLFRTERNGKYSSTKTWGHIVMLLVCSSFIIDGLKFYQSNTHLFDAMLIAGTTLIGLNAATGIFKRKKDEQE